jgi:hypothetical protein
MITINDYKRIMNYSCNQPKCRRLRGLELAITETEILLTNQRNKSTVILSVHAYVRTCVRAEEATYLVRAYIYVVTLYSFIVMYYTILYLKL